MNSKQEGDRMSFIEKIGAATMAGDRKLVTELTRDALEAGTDIDSIIQEGFIPAMATVGEEFSSGKRYIPEMLLAARAMQQGMELIKPLLVEGTGRRAGTRGPGHGSGRPARHRQKPAGHDDGGIRPGGHGSGCRCCPGEVRIGRGRTQTRVCGPVRVVDHDHAGHENNHRTPWKKPG